ncbi:MAG: rod shape-determining protein MreD [Rikenellaceae bacterium]
MKYTIQYLYLLIVLLVLQFGLLGNLSLGVWLLPMPYIAFIALLPLDISRTWLLFIGLALGVVVDIFSGTSSLNTISTLLIAFARPYLLDALKLKDGVDMGGVPSKLRMGGESLNIYLVVLILLHSLCYFCFESLSLLNIELTALRIGVSSLVSLLLIWPMVDLFNIYLKRS